MRFQKGNQEAKKKGKHLKTKAWEELGDYFTHEGAERAINIMKGSKDEKFMQFYINLVELFKPKLARTETFGQVQQETTLVIRKEIVMNPQLNGNGQSQLHTGTD